MNIQISEHFTYKKLIRFTIPSIVMMVFTSIYSIVDGIFVSNFVGKTSFAAVNLIMPVSMLFSSVGFMIGTGGTALVAKYLGEKNIKKANQVFSLLIYVTIFLGIIISVFEFIFMDKIAILLGAEGKLLEDSILYGRILTFALTAFMLQNSFQSFLIAAGKPTMGLILTIAAGVTNMILDALFIIVFDWGLAGAAIATCVSQLVGGLIPFVYFILPNKSPLKLGKFVWDGFSLVKTVLNGSSELLSNIAMSIVSILYNFQLLQIAGENGVASYGSLMYVSFIFAAVFIGWGIGTSPIVSYNYGAENKSELKNLFKKDVFVISVLSVFLTLLSEVLAYPLAKLFTGYDLELFEMTKRAFRIYSFAYLFMGFNMTGSSFFTALNNGFISALISFLRTLVFQVICVLVIPKFLGLDGIWLSGIAAELLSIIIVIFCVVKYKKVYGY